MKAFPQRKITDVFRLRDFPLVASFSFQEGKVAQLQKFSGESRQTFCENCEESSRFFLFLYQTRLDRPIFLFTLLENLDSLW